MSTCTIPGDGDLYGIGVRLGLYLQWLAGFLLRNMDGTWKTISSVRTTNTALSTALNLCAVISAVRGIGSPIDYPIVYYLTVALFYSESYNLMRKDNTCSGGESNKADFPSQSELPPRSRIMSMLQRKAKPGYYYELNPDAALVAQNVLFASATLFGAWFWLRGVFGFAELPLAEGSSSGCGSDAGESAKGALLGVFNLFDDRWRRFAAACSVIAGLLLVLILSVHAASLAGGGLVDQPVGRAALDVLEKFHVVCGGGVLKIVERKEMERLLRPRLSLRAAYKKGGWRRLAMSVFHWFVINLLGPLLAITSVERMLVANQVATPTVLESSGQMIALLSGIMSFCVAVWDIARPAARASNVDLLASYMYMARRPLSEKEMEKALENLSKAVDEYSIFPEFINGRQPRTQRQRRPATSEDIV
jgi:hypothetical protein